MEIEIELNDELIIKDIGDQIDNGKVIEDENKKL